MIVRLTHPQISTVRARIPLLHSCQMQLHRERANRTQSDISLPAIAWRQIVDHLKATAYGPMGGRLGKNPPSLYLAIQKIQDAVNEIECHPALSRHGVMGTRTEVIPAWRKLATGYSPYPVGEEFVILMPRHHEHNAVKYTTWYESTSPVGVTEEESFHLRFCEGVEQGHVDDVNRAGVD